MADVQWRTSVVFCGIEVQKLFGVFWTFLFNSTKMHLLFLISGTLQKKSKPLDKFPAQQRTTGHPEGCPAVNCVLKFEKGNSTAAAFGCNSIDFIA